MKQLFASILLIVYFTVSTGFVVSVHYCMDKVDSVVLGDSTSDECSKCGMHIEDSGGCCKDDVRVVKLQSDQAFAKITVPDFSYSVIVQPFFESTLFTSYSSPQQKYPLAHGPPLNKQDSYLQNCVFRL